MLPAPDATEHSLMRDVKGNTPILHCMLQQKEDAFWAIFEITRNGKLSLKSLYQFWNI